MSRATARAVSQRPGSVSVLRSCSSRPRPRWPRRADELLDLALDLLHRRGRSVGLHGRDREERPLRLRIDDERVRAVRPAFVLAQVHVDARREGAAEDVVHRFDGDVVGLVALTDQVPRDDHALLGAGPVDEVDARLGGQRDVGQRLGRHVAAAANRANSASSFGWISASVVSPTTISVALFGLNHESW